MSLDRRAAEEFGMVDDIISEVISEEEHVELFISKSIHTGSEPYCGEPDRVEVLLASMVSDLSPAGAHRVLSLVADELARAWGGHAWCEPGSREEAICKALSDGLISARRGCELLRSHEEPPPVEHGVELPERYRLSGVESVESVEEEGEGAEQP